MTNPPLARLAYITEPEPDTVWLNLQFDPDQPRVTDVTASGSRFERVQITRDQLANIVKDGVGVLG
jgi:hypothetical protein